jgi:hypothetical protein
LEPTGSGSTVQPGESGGLRAWKRGQPGSVSGADGDGHAVTRTPATKRPRNTALGPWRAKKRSPTEEKADVVADDGGSGSDGDDGRQRVVSLVGEDGGGQQRGLARNWNAHGLGGHEPGERRLRCRAADRAQRERGAHLSSAPPA